MTAKRICSVADCPHPVHGRGYCNTHYAYWRKNGHPVPPPRPKACLMDGCDEAVHGHGLCGTHWSRWYRTGDPLETTRHPLPEKCIFGGCDEKPLARGWCVTHYNRWVSSGDPSIVRTPKGEEHYSWAGEDSGYVNTHQRMRKAKGKASDHPCVDCGGPARDWSYRHDGTMRLIDSVGSPYSTDPDDYVPRCKACHNVYDGVNERKGKRPQEPLADGPESGTLAP